MQKTQHSNLSKTLKWLVILYFHYSKHVSCFLGHSSIINNHQHKHNQLFPFKTGFSLTSTNTITSYKTKSMLNMTSKSNHEIEIYIPVEIIYENKTYHIQAIKGESVLSALERARASPDPNIRIPLPPIQHECRRGNCLTCSGRIVSSKDDIRERYSNIDDSEKDKFSLSPSKYSNLIRGEDGLNPFLSKEIESAGFVLLCSSYVVGEGLRIEIGCKEEAWDFIYAGKMTGHEAEFDRTAVRFLCMPMPCFH